MDRFLPRRFWPMLCAGLLLTAGSAHGWPRAHYSMAEVIDRSKVIVVARIKLGSIKYVPHDRRWDEGNSGEHHAILIVSEVLKGKLDEKVTPIIIHYGLKPVVGGYRAMRGGKDYPKDVIGIVDTGGGVGGIVKDAGKNSVWFLRRRSGRYGRKPGTGNFGIVDPQDLGTLELREAVKAYLAKDGEALCRLLDAGRPAVARCAVVEILASMRYAPAAPLVRGLAMEPAQEGWPSVPRVATRALAAFPGQESRETLEAVAAGPDTGPRHAAVWTLSEYIDRDTIAFLEGLRKRLDPDKRADRNLIQRIHQSLRDTREKLDRTERAAALAALVKEQGAAAAAGRLTPADIEALWCRNAPEVTAKPDPGDAQVAPAVWAYCLKRFRQDLSGYRADSRTFRFALEYLGAVKYRPPLETIARAMTRMTWKKDYSGIYSTRRYLRYCCAKDDPEALAVLLPAYLNNAARDSGTGCALSDIGGLKTIAALLELLKAPPETGRQPAGLDIYRMLWQFKAWDLPEPRAELQRMDAAGQGKGYALVLLAERPDPERDRRLLTLALDETAPLCVRDRAIRLIGRRKMKHAREPLETLGRGPHLHAAIAQAMRFIGTRESVPTIASYLNDDDKEAPLEATYALREILHMGDLIYNPESVEKARRWWAEHREEFEPERNDREGR